MGRDISIVISAKDNFSDAITKMRNANQSFNKDLSGLSTKLDKINNNKTTLKVDTDKARKALKEAEKQFIATGDAADELALELAGIEYESARRNLDLLSKNARQTEKDILSLTNAISKSDNRASSTKTLAGGTSGTSESLAGVATAGLLKMFGDTLSSSANTLVSSGFGSDIGNMFSNVLGSAVSGAAIGSIIPGIGTLIGAGIGGAVGLVSGTTSIYENKDETFKDYYSGQYNTTLEGQNATLEKGKIIASTREQNKISFSTLLGGDDNATKFLEEITKFANETPFEYDDLTNISKTLLAYGYKQDEILPILTKVGDAGSALGMSTEDMKYVATSLGRMQTTGKTTMEYLNPLLERGIDVWSYLAEASGKTKSKVQEMVSKGLVPGAEAAKAIADYMGFNYNGNMEKQAETFQGLLSTLEDGKAELENSMGEGYVETRKKGISDEIEYFSDNPELANAYKQIGSWKASLENLTEQYERDALSAVMDGTVSDIFSEEAKDKLTQMYQEYTSYASSDAEDAGAKMGALLAEAQALAQNEYNASEGAQLALKTNMELADNIKNNAGLKEEYWSAGYEMGQQFSKGLASALLSNEMNNPQKNHFWGGGAYHGFREDENKSTTSGEAIYGVGAYRPHAFGINYIPYNNYPAMLHEGERVLTASENRSLNNAPPITITGNNFVIREENDINKIAAEIVEKFKMALDIAI